MTNTIIPEEVTTSSSIDLISTSDTSSAEAASVDKDSEKTITHLSTIIAKLSFQLDTEKIKNIQWIEDNEKITKEVGLKNIELEKTKFRMNLISNELSTRNTDIEKIMQRNKNDLQEEKIRHYRATEDLNHRNADLEKEHVLSSTLIRTLRDEENRNIKFVENLQYQIKLLKSDVNVDNEHLIFDLKQKIIELIEDLKWANMMGSLNF
jgi:hypothetical protein